VGRGGHLVIPHGLGSTDEDRAVPRRLSAGRNAGNYQTSVQVGHTKLELLLLTAAHGLPC
jgi:hypothetical protein